MTSANSILTSTVTLNLFQGPFCLSAAVCAARWMLERQSPGVKQVQHDATGRWVTIS
jgi:hypothetical protein